MHMYTKHLLRYADVGKVTSDLCCWLPRNPRDTKGDPFNKLLVVLNSTKRS